LVWGLYRPCWGVGVGRWVGLFLVGSVLLWFVWEVFVGRGISAGGLSCGGGGRELVGGLACVAGVAWCGFSCFGGIGLG